MKFATGRVGGVTCLLRDHEDGWLNLSSDMRFASINDVGALLCASSDAIAFARTTREGIVVSAAEVDFAPLLISPPKIICIGLNYARHAIECGDPLPKRPVVFSKFSNCLIGARDAVEHPASTEQLDYEAELAVVIGRRARNVSEGDAGQYIAGFTVANDLTARDLQAQDEASQWVLGKSLDGFCPLGPWLTMMDAVPSWTDLQIRAWVNNELRQDESCSDMIFSVEKLIAFLSRDMTLEPGDVILTGTPSGVGVGMSPQRFLVPGDVVRVAIDGLGELENRIVAPPVLN